MSILSIFRRKEKEIINLDNKLVDKKPERVINENIQKYQTSRRFYEGVSGLELLKLVPRNKTSKFLPDYYNEYYDFYLFFKEKIEKKERIDFDGLEEVFFDWFRGVLAEYAQLVLIEEESHSTKMIEGSIAEVVLDNCRFICDAYNGMGLKESIQIVKLLSRRYDYPNAYNEWKTKMETAVKEKKVDFSWYFMSFSPMYCEYIPSELFFSFINLESYLTDLGYEYKNLIIDRIIDSLEKDFEKSTNNFVYRFSTISEHTGDRGDFDWLAECWPKERTIIKHRVTIGRSIRKKDEKKIRNFVHEVENEIRTELGLPEIGDGWISETILFKQIQSVFFDEKVLKHFSPPFLGRQHYDVFMPEHAIAIEYQGEQHSKPIDFFGGKEAFTKTQERDERKKRLSEENGINLIYVYPRYDIRALIKNIAELIKKPEYFERMENHIVSEESVRKDEKDKMQRLLSIGTKRRAISDDEKIAIKKKLLSIEARMDEGMWVQLWSWSYQIRNAEALDLEESDVDQIVQSAVYKVPKPYVCDYNYVSIIKNGIKYYKKHCSFDKGIRLAQYAIANDISEVGKDDIIIFKKLFKRLKEEQEKAEEKDSLSLSGK